ncbi:MAG: glycosyltransferase [Melioribacteraceae bacterium]|nr:glycosyltransferase [Melioribacteraceae bacterium]
MKINQDVLRAFAFFESNGILGEVIVVDDGSADHTYNKVISLTDRFPENLKVIKHSKNLGKGFAVKSGIQIATGEILLYSDVGNIVPFENLIPVLKRMQNEGIDILNGSRKLADSKITKEQDYDRKLTSWLFNKLVLNYLDVPSRFTDTQCGFKLYRKDVAKKLFGDLQTPGFLFEIEIILRALKMNYIIEEFPLEWKCDRDSRINIVDTTPKVFKEVIRLKRLFKEMN